MKKFTAALAAALLLALPLSNAEAINLGNIFKGNNNKAVNQMDNKTVTLTTLPTTAAEVHPDQDAHKVAAFAIAALTRYEQDPAESIAMLNALKGPRPLSEYEKQFMRDRFRTCPYVARSFFKGATPQNDYTPAQPYAVTVESTPYTYQEAGYAKFYLRSGGADSSRPLVLRQKGSTGEWFVWEHANLLGQIRIPVSQDPWH